jgi:putative transposase
VSGAIGVALIIVRPEIFIAWHRRGFRLFWRWRIRYGQHGRPGVPNDVRQRIRTRSRENPLWGAPGIHGELLKLGIDVGQTSVAKYRIRFRQPPCQTGRTFLDKHVKTMISVDFFTVPTIRFQILYVFLVLAHDRRRILPFNVTAHPTAEWTGHQLPEGFPLDQIPRYWLRDHDGIFGIDFTRQVKAMGIEEVLSAPRSPWQRAYLEGVIGTIRRECVDHRLVFGEDSLGRTLRSRTHWSLSTDAPDSRPVHPAKPGQVIAIPQVGGAASPIRATRRLNFARSILRSGRDLCVQTCVCRRVRSCPPRCRPKRLAALPIPPPVGGLP